jgi:regulator of RNase E activity RraB
MPLSPANQRDADLEIIGALTKAGSNMAKPHTLEHHFVSKSKTGLESLRDHAVSSKYRVSDILWTGRLFKTYFLDIVVDTVPTIDNVTSATTTMHQLAAEYSSSYDGWGCAVVE